MTPRTYALLFVVFWLGYFVSHWCHGHKLIDLRVALGDLSRAVDAGDWRPYRDTETGRRVMVALERAREVLRK